MKVKLNEKYYYAKRHNDKTYLYKNIIYYLIGIASPSLSTAYQLVHGEFF